jgi:hypothetical protein
LDKGSNSKKKKKEGTKIKCEFGGWRWLRWLWCPSEEAEAGIRRPQQGRVWGDQIKGTSTTKPKGQRRVYARMGPEEGSRKYPLTLVQRLVEDSLKPGVVFGPART